MGPRDDVRGRLLVTIYEVGCGLAVCWPLVAVIGVLGALLVFGVR